MRRSDVKRSLDVRRKAALLRLSGAGRPVHFLHIGKTAGTAIEKALAAAPAPARMIKHGHPVTLRHLPRGADYVFVVRDPLERFYSGFYSRKREGRPRRHVPWNPNEARAFARFEHANDLADIAFVHRAEAWAAARAAADCGPQDMNISQS